MKREPFPSPSDSARTDLRLYRLGSLVALVSQWCILVLVVRAHIPFAFSVSHEMDCFHGYVKSYFAEEIVVCPEVIRSIALVRIAISLSTMYAAASFSRLLRWSLSSASSGSSHTVSNPSAASDSVSSGTPFSPRTRPM